MKLIKSLSRGLLIFLIIISIGALIYIMQWEEEPAGVKIPEKEISKTEKPKAILPKVEKDKTAEKTPAVPKTVSGKEKEKTVVSKIEKIPLPLYRIAIIIDDIGNDLKPVRELLKIDAQITFAILPLCSHTHDAAEMLHKAGRETLLHLPMEPTSYPREKPGNGALFTDMNDRELLFQLDKNLASVPHVSGVNNHMGSKFMTDEDKLRLIFDRLKKNNLFFVDSRTTTDSKAEKASDTVGLPMASRRIFLDNRRSYKEISKVLLEVAEDKDVAPVIIIGHPYPETIRAIKDAIGILKAKGVTIVPVSQLIKDNVHRKSS
jgi:uncharacterized protein